MWEPRSRRNRRVSTVSRPIFVEPTEAQKGRLTSVTDIRSRFDSWRKKGAEYPGGSGLSGDEAQ